MVRLICPRCGRKGQYRKENLIEKYGPAVALPDLLHLIANCERYGKASNPCWAKRASRHLRGSTEL
jgi:hypothetical protein